MIINIDGDDLESLEQLKGYFNPDPTPDSKVFAELLDYGQHGDLAGWLREHGEEGMASKIDAIPEGLSDSKYYAALKQAVTGETMVDTSSLKPSFERCFHFEGADCDIEVNEAKVKVNLKVLMSVNEDYRLKVRSGWKPCEKKVNSYNYSEGDSVVVEFVISKIQNQEIGNLVVLADGKELDNEKALPKGENLDFEVGGVSFKMIRVEGGTFTSEPYGNERPAHQVTLSSYYIGETQVTQALWRAVMRSNPSCCKGDNLPVESVSWDDCMDFVRELNRQLKNKRFRMPTEAEWEYAARGGNKSKDYKYSGSNDIDAVAWYSGNSGHKTHPVATKLPNELGIYDMSGNVWEWCSDWWEGGHRDSPHGARRVNRGGSCRYDKRNCRVSDRYGAPSYDGLYNLGLRLVLSE